MKTHSVCLPILATLALSAAVTRANVSNTPRGVSPSNANLYVPDKANNWSCLDGSRTLPFSAVNDDYCDCSDGSDEPGTSACGTGTYYCANIGHTPSSIKTSRVNDGVCDEECCDGSDEYDGQTHCPNVCSEVGAKAREEYDRVQSIQNEGARLRRGLIKYGKATKISLNKELEALKDQVDEVKGALAEAKDKLDAANAAQDAYLEGSKNEREAVRKQQLEPLIQEQTKRLNYAIEIKDMLKLTLQNLKENHNKNYHDLAVKGTVSGFDEYIESRMEEKTGETAQDETTISSDRQFDELVDKTSFALRDIGTLYDLLEGMKRDYNTEYNDEAVLAAVKITDDFEVTWDSSKQDFVDVDPLVLPEELPLDTPEAEKFKEETDLAQDAFNDAAEKESKVQDGIRDIERKLGMDLGHDETFAQLVDECFDFKDTEYTYSICLFGDANQRSQSTTHLGKFSGWEGDNYDMQMYTGGTKCWNGPERSVKLIMTCGTTTEIVSVTEPEKCEYLFKLQTPAVCPVPEEQEEGDDTEEQQQDGQDKEEEHTRKHDELSMLYRFREAKNAELGGSKVQQRRPFRVSEVTSLTEAEKWRRNVIGDISRKMSKIQDSTISEFQIRDLNDELNKLMREKYRWEQQIVDLGGIDYRITGPKTLDAQGKEVPGARGYKYFGRAKELPGVKELFQPKPLTLKEKTRAELHRNVDADYYGYRDEEDGTLLEFEEEEERIAMEKALEQAEEADEDAMEVDGKTEKTEALGTLFVPSQKEVEEYLVKRRKQAILDRYVNEDLISKA
ncbi:hypothetical protein EC991_005433 [Linnemannia zychae]|nr:hypothetical protein EC991_005433 [Linnemannia zychae]